jgi:heptosyltransferase-3
MLMPSIAALGASTEITFAGRSPGLFYLKPYVHRTMDYEGPGWHTLFQEEAASRPDFVLPPSDLVIAFLSDPGGTVKKNLRYLLSDTPAFVFAPFPSKGTGEHVALYLARCLKEAGLPITPEKCLESAAQKALLKKDGGLSRNGAVVFHPGSGSEGKNHPPAFWVTLIREWMRHFDMSRDLTLLFGPAEEGLYAFFKDHPDTIGIEKRISPEHSELVSLLSRARLYVGHDSGITHLAAMLGTPAIALFKNSPAKQWRPLGPFLSMIEKEDTNTGLALKVLREAEKLEALAYGRH